MAGNTSKMKKGSSTVDEGWSWVVMMASFAGFFVLGGCNYSVGLIHKTILERYHADNAQTAWVGALHTALMNLAGPLSSFVLDRFSCRTAIITSGILFTIGYLGTAFAPTLGMSIFTCGIIAGIAGGFGWTCNMICMGFYFRRYLNLAQGVAFSGVGVGLFGMAPAIEAAHEEYGHFGFFIALAGFSLHLVVFGMLMQPSELEIENQRKRRLDASKADSSSKGALLRDYWRVLRNKAVISMSASMFVFNFGIYIVFIMLPNYSVYVGFTAMDASYLLSACGVASILGRLLTGFACNCEDVDEVLLYSGSIGLVGIGSLLFPSFSHSYSGQMVFAIIVGFYFGCCYVVMSTINIRYVGVKNMAAAMGIELFFGGIGAMLGPVVSGTLLDSGCTYDVIFIIAGFSLVFSAMFGLLTVVVSVASDDLIKLPINEEIEIPRPEDSTEVLTDKSLHKTAAAATNGTNGQLQTSPLLKDDISIST